MGRAVTVAISKSCVVTALCSYLNAGVLRAVRSSLSLCIMLKYVRCEHGITRRYRCKDCAVAEKRACEHGNAKSACTKCNPRPNRGRCPHSKLRHNCWTCSPHLFCGHNCRKQECGRCATNVGTACLHGRVPKICLRCAPRPVKSPAPVAPADALRSDPAWSFLRVGAEDRSADWPVDESEAHPFAGWRDGALMSDLFSLD
jgi:hypothetical protein